MLLMFFLLTLNLFLFSIISWMMFIYFNLNNIKMFINWNLLTFNSMKIEFNMFIDWMSLIFLSTMLFITSMVILYSMNYMNNDLYLKRFMMMIIIFMMSMILMILSSNLILILFGWDGLGLSSYCLVSYYMSKKSFNSSMVTILMNRFGDIMMLLCISLLMKYGSWNFLFMFKINLFYLMLIFIAAITKSAQIPFSTWLPLAMAAPTPISSLVHSSTLVTAGVYLLIRFSYLMNNNFYYMMMIISCTTMFMAGMSANMEFDLKKIIALSTLSQLGLMIMTISINLNKLAFFHLITHAMFKSLMFLCSGIIIHNFLNNQDIRFISLMNNNQPFINMILNIASMTLCGMPFLTGFYSKDLIIEMFIMFNNNFMIFMMMFLSMGMTIMYTFRLIFYISIKNIKMNLINLYNSYNLMNYSIIPLTLMSMFYGSSLNYLLLSSLNTIMLSKFMKTLIYWFLIYGIMLGIFLPKLKINMKKMLFLYKFINNMWFLPMIYKSNKNILKLNNKMIFFNEKSWLEFMSSKKIIFLIQIMYTKKKINKINFLMNILISLYIIFIFFI